MGEVLKPPPFFIINLKSIIMYQETETTEIMNPREWNENLGTMLCFHRRYILGDKNPYNSGDYWGFTHFAESLRRVHDIALMLPIYMYNHGGITISYKPFSCPWDSGQVGWIFMNKDQVRREFGVKRISKKVMDKVRSVLIAEIEDYNEYLTQ
jgi:hypothetical protein